MRTFILFIACLVLFKGHAQTLSAVDWQKDLRFLQEIVHEDYPFLFKKVTASEFDKAVETFYNEIPDMEAHEVVVGFSKIIGLFKYGHTRMSFRDSPVAFHKLPMQLFQFSDGIYITGIQEEYKDFVGARILEIEGKDMKEVLKAIYPVEPVENDQFFKAYGINTALFPEVLHAQGVTDTLKTELTLTLEKEGKEFTVKVQASENLKFPLHYGEVKPDSDWVSARDIAQPPLYLKNLDKIYYFEHLPEEKAVYVRHSQIQDDLGEPIPAFYKRLFEFIENNPVERLVIDVRLNGGGNNYKNKPIITGIIETQKINQTGKLYVILGRRTFSACQNLVNEFSNYTNVIFVGEPTGENINFYGDNRKVVLPNSKLPVYLSFAWWQDKPQWENGPYMPADIPVELRFDDYKSGKDPVLAKALSFDGEGFVRDPMAYLRGLFMEGKMELLQTEAKRLVNDPLYAHVGFEQEFNRAGYGLLDSDQIQEAIFVFELSAGLFPESAYTWSSLAEAYEKKGNVEKAKEYYMKTISLDATGPAGKLAKKRLDALK
ncbi:hypothetical protein [Flagellimonas allohymeniacidonis]|uniref:Uncharacterized protein n=1 Tax=Flagellimonas allohymeniacidonis TaxID=2517819 RepID=A0A4Q8QEE7_9FLAO|nr:hypothetical protein [Allomuricauda hymeniacidonis]TAI48835.1 hypothetical protein EW142_03280 [Allomuricauda hymeniacidonis]